MTRARMPGSLSTSTEIVALRVGWPDMEFVPSAVSLRYGRRRAAPNGPRSPGQVRGGPHDDWEISDQNEALIGDRGSVALGTDAEDHFVMRGTAGDHREAVFLGIHGDVGNDRDVAGQHLMDHRVQFVDGL